MHFLKHNSFKPKLFQGLVCFNSSLSLFLVHILSLVEAVMSKYSYVDS